MTISTDLPERPRVLLVDDHKTTRRLMSAWLEMSGYAVEQAEDGGAAWKNAKFDCPPIVVTDWNMPNMSGLDLCRSIRQQHGPDDIYVLIATARDTGDDLSAAMEAGANDFLSKPIREEEFLARIRSAEIALSRLQEKTKLADLDSLTGLLNQRAFRKQASPEFERLVASGRPVSCVLLDIDHFKHFNDQFGHSTGDEVLRMVADVIGENIRSGDLASRLGGDEFCILLPNSSEADAVKFADRIRYVVEARSRNETGDGLCVQTTLGVASAACGAENIEALIERADAALLTAKSEGRNRTLSKGEIDSREQSCLGERCSVVTWLRDLHAETIMSTSIAIFQDTEFLKDVRGSFISSAMDCACIVNARSELVGLVSERDFMATLATQFDCKRQLSTVMNNNISRFTQKTSLAVIWDSMQRNPMLRVVIVDERNFPLGLITRHAVLETVHRLLSDG